MVKLALVGFGNIGKDFARLLLSQAPEVDRIKQHGGQDVTVVAIATASRGNLVCKDGVNLECALNELESGKFSEQNPDYSPMTTLEIIKTCNADVVVEISVLSVSDGQPAVSYIEAALNTGKHVISCNKGPLVWAFSHLRKLAKDKGLCFYYEGCVMDGCPVFNLAQLTLPACQVLSFRGILNSTTNFVLGELEKGATVDAAIEEAKARGFAEADPSNDLDGWDGAFKTAALMAAMLDTPVAPTDVARDTMGDVDAAAVKEAAAAGTPMKFVCVGERGGRGRVQLQRLSPADPLAHIQGTSSALTLVTDMMGTISVVETNPEIRQTTYAVVSDLLRILKGTSQ